MRRGGVKRAAASAALAVLLACTQSPDESHADSPPPDLDLLGARLDSGAAAYRAGEIGRARTIYGDIARADSTLAAAWFGIFMTERLLGDTLAADSALRRARELAATATPGH